MFVFSTTTSGEVAAARWTGGRELSSPKLIPGPANSDGIAAEWQPGASFLYVADPAANAIRVYRINLPDGNLSPAGVGPYPLTGALGAPQQIIIFENDLYVASSGGSISAYFINPGGALSSVSGSPFTAGAGASNLCAQGSSLMGDTAYIFVADTDDPNGGISAYTINPNGGLTPVPGSPFPTVATGEPEGLLCAGKTLYVALHNAAAVGAYAIAADGSLTALAGAPITAAAGVSSLEEFGGYFYAENSTAGSVSAYSSDPESGGLTPIAGSPFPAAGATGELLMATDTLLVPQASAFLGLQADSASGALRLLTGSPFLIGATPVASILMQLPVQDP
jgi:hypothetical protein